MNVSQAEYWAALLPGIIAFLAPALASLVSREHWPAIVTGGLTVAITAAAAFLTQLIQGGDYSWTLATLKAFAAYLIAAEARSQFWSKTHTDAKLLAFPRKLPKRGEVSSHYAGVPDPQPQDQAA